MKDFLILVQLSRSLVKDTARHPTTKTGHHHNNDENTGENGFHLHDAQGTSLMDLHRMSVADVTEISFLNLTSVSG